MLFFNLESGKNETNMEIRIPLLDFSRIRVYILLKFGNSPAAELKKQERDTAMRVMVINGSPRKNWNTVFPNNMDKFAYIGGFSGAGNFSGPGAAPGGGMRTLSNSGCRDKHSAI